MNIIKKKINLDLRLKSINLNKSDENLIKFYPSISKEWKNSVYLYNKTNIKNIPVNDNNINELINFYSNIYFKRKFLKNKRRRKQFRKKFKLFTTKKLFVSKAEVKHFNYKTIITIFLYDRHRKLILSRIRYNKKWIYRIVKRLIVSYAKLKKLYLRFKKLNVIKILKLKMKLKKIIIEKLLLTIILRIKFIEKISKNNKFKLYIKKLKNNKTKLFNILIKVWNIFNMSKKIVWKSIKNKKKKQITILRFIKQKYKNKYLTYNQVLYNKVLSYLIKRKKYLYLKDQSKKIIYYIKRKRKYINLKYMSKKILLRFFKRRKIFIHLKTKYNLFFYRIRKQWLKKLRIELRYLRRYKYKLNLNKYKFEEKFLYILNSLLNKYYNKKIEFNVVRLKNFKYNTDIFTEVLALKFTSRRISVSKLMGGVFNITKRIDADELKPAIWSKSLNIIQNKFKDLHLYYVIGAKESFNLKLQELFNNVINLKSKDRYEKILENTINSIKYRKFRGVKAGSKGRLTRRYRADRSIDKLFLEGGLRNLDSSFKERSVSLYRGINNANVEYSICVKKRRIGSYAVKGWLGYY